LIPAVRKAAYALFAADVGAGGLVSLVTGGLWSEQPPDGTSAPYVVGNFQSSVEEDAFGNDGSYGAYSFNIYTPKNDSGGDAASVNTAAESIIGRIRTVYQRQTQTVAFNGSNWKVYFQAESSLVIPERDTFWHHVEIYRFHCYPA